MASISSDSNGQHGQDVRATSSGMICPSNSLLLTMAQLK